MSDVEGDAFEHDLVEGLALLGAAASVELISPAEQFEGEIDSQFELVVLFA